MRGCASTARATTREISRPVAAPPTECTRRRECPPSSPSPPSNSTPRSARSTIRAGASSVSTRTALSRHRSRPAASVSAKWSSGDDSPELHFADTLAAGRDLCRESAVRVLTDEAPARIVDLADLGVEFDGGLGLEGGHSRRRVHSVGGAATGREISRVVARAVLAHPRIQVSEGERALELLVEDGRCAGVSTDRGVVRARAVLLATGGYAALW